MALWNFGRPATSTSLDVHPGCSIGRRSKQNTFSSVLWRGGTLVFQGLASTHWWSSRALAAGQDSVSALQGIAERYRSLWLTRYCVSKVAYNHADINSKCTGDAASFGQAASHSSGITFQPSSLRSAGKTTRLKVTMLLTGLPGKPNTNIFLRIKKFIAFLSTLFLHMPSHACMLCVLWWARLAYH